MNDSSRSHFAAKHPPGTVVAPNLRAALESRLEKGSITCSVAHDIARALAAESAVVGQAIDLLEGRIQKCQLGLFGYSPDKKIVTTDQSVAPDLCEAILISAQNGRITCADAWAVAERLSVPRLSIGVACESLGIKIVHCQLGAF